jgi:translation initiation factor IF-1
MTYYDVVDGDLVTAETVPTDRPEAGVEHRIAS